MQKRSAIQIHECNDEKSGATGKLIDFIHSKKHIISFLSRRLSFATFLVIDSLLLSGCYQDIWGDWHLNNVGKACLEVALMALAFVVFGIGCIVGFILVSFLVYWFYRISFLIIGNDNMEKDVASDHCFLLSFLFWIVVAILYTIHLLFDVCNLNTALIYLMIYLIITNFMLIRWLKSKK